MSKVFSREELEEMLGEVSRHQGLRMLDKNIDIGRAFDEVAGKNKKLKLNKPISHKTTYYNRGIGNHGEIHDGSTRVVSINYDHSKKKYNVIPGEHLSGRPTTHDTIESATKALKKHVDNHIGQTETTTENFTREELEEMLSESQAYSALFAKSQKKAEEYKNLSRDELAEKLKTGYFNKTTGKWKIDDSHGPMNLRKLSLTHKLPADHYAKRLGLVGNNESEQLDEAKRPAHWHSHQLDNIEDMIASAGHTPHPTKFMANPSDADLAGHYEKEADKHGKLAQLNDTACFHAENSGRDYSCDKHKSMAEINIMKSDLYKTLAGLYQMSHDIEK